MLDEGILTFKWHALWGEKINVMIANQKTKFKIRHTQKSMLFVQLTLIVIACFENDQGQLWYLYFGCPILHIIKTFTQLLTELIQFMLL